MPRRAIQIAVSDEEVHALCNDGTIWLRRKGAREWQRLPDVPGDYGQASRGTEPAGAELPACRTVDPPARDPPARDQPAVWGRGLGCCESPAPR